MSYARKNIEQMTGYVLGELAKAFDLSGNHHLRW